MLDTNSSSVYFLISELCENLLHEYSPNEPINVTSVKKLKSKSYEILLKKSKNYNINLEETVNPIKELDILLFASKIKARNDYKILKNCENLEEHLKYISNETYFTEANGQNILTFLLQLHNNLLDTENHEENNLLIPGPFTLHSEFSTNSYYPNIIQNKSSKPEHFRGLHTLMDYQNPYLPKLLFENDSRQFPQLDSPKCTANSGCVIQPKPFCFSSLKNSNVNNDTWGNTLAMNTTQSCKSLNSDFQFNAIAPKLSFDTTSSRISKIPLDDDKEGKRFCWDWENLGQSNITVAKPFTSEVGNSLYLESIMEESIGNNFIAKIVPIESFIIDLKSLAVGIQSDSFEHDSLIIFHMVPNITIPGVSPNILKNYIIDFLECGTCYKRLNIMIMKHNYRLMFDGFIFKALCSAVEDYLVMFRQFVYSYEDKTLLNFSKRMKKMIKQISSLSCTLAIHPDGDINIKPPMGSQFLGYLYKEIMRVTQKDLIMLLVYILKRCCHVYFKHLQKWIFYGILDDPSNELFVGFVDHYRQYTKYHYDKSYFVRKESVPGFFQGYEDQILQCGKYAMLLKAFKPNHPLFEMDYPSMSVYLSFNEIEYMEEQCREYLEKARIVCGKPVTVNDMFTKKAESRTNFFRLVSERTQKNFEKWAAEKEESVATQFAEKKTRFNEITKLLEESKNRKLAEKMANIELERKILKEIQEKEDKEIELENCNIKKRIEYYKELSSLMEKRKTKINKEIENSATLSINIPIDENPETPLVTARTDFNSCSDDDEIDTEYDDCISSIIKTSDKVSLSETMNEICENNNENDNALIQEITSDYLNSNEINSEKVLTEFQRNRNKGLYSDSDNYYSDTLLRVETENIEKPEIFLSEAQRNKLKVLNHECRFDDYEPIDLNSNLLDKNKPATELSELQKNRLKMMQNDTFGMLNKEPGRRNLNLDLNTERYRNRRKVLESEFDILTGIQNSPNTPMSTTSDSAPTLPIKEESFNKLQDTENANYQDTILKINIDLDKMELDIPTAIIEDTPECGLNTAGILAKQGFNFESSKHENSLHNNSFEFNLDSEPKILDEDLPYKRCEELLKTNFKCKPISTYFQLTEYKVGDFESDENEKIKNLLQNQKDLNSLSVITLTEFLQKSVVTPLNAHLEILNNEVMRVFLEDLDIIGHLSSLRNYFFLMDGEFGCIICDELISKLENCNATPNELLNYQMLHSILDNAIGSSIMGNDKNADNLSFIVNDLPEKFDLNSPSVLLNLSLSYRVEWPLNLILNPESLEQYGNIFKYLIKVRRISWVLEESFQMLKEIVKSNGKDMLLSPQYRRVQQIRHKFFHFVHALKNHITSSALQASWKTFKDDLLSARSIEDIYRKHTNYIKKILFLCMLNRRSVEFFNTIENIFKVTLRFYRNLKARTWKKKPGNEFFTHSRYDKLLMDEIEFEKFIKYTIYLGNKIVKHGYQEEIGEFISLINYNQYYVIDS